MAKDKENLGFPFDEPVLPTEPQGFAPEQMIRCEECLRANPPTRVACLYCAAVLPQTETSLRLRRPTLRPPGKHELGQNSIYLPAAENLPAFEELTEAATLLKLMPENLQQIVAAGIPLPVARTSSREEAELVRERLRELGLETVTLSDHDLGLMENLVTRVRSMRLDEGGITVPQSGSNEVIRILWPDLVLIVSGRFFIKRVEVKERKSRKAENEILESSEFSSDEAVVDLYASSSLQTWRIGANGFDFSCLEEQKSLIANENLIRLVRVIAAKAPHALLDDSYNGRKQALEPVWGADKETHSQGWRREGPGKYSLGAATVDSNESQFTRYSRLRFYFRLNQSS